MTELDLSYTAATIDCEGSIGIVRHLSSHGKGGISWYQLTVAVSMTTEAVPAWLHGTFGGSLGFYNYNKHPKHRGFYVWYLGGNKAAEFIRLILPYLKLKLAQAELALEFQESKRSRQGRATSVSEREHQETLRSRMQELNKRGVK